MKFLQNLKNQYILFFETSAQLQMHGLLRRYAPRNDFVLQRKSLRAKRSNL